jgi:putative tryptophan/tyrosine transport system substrate-binding protein
MRFFQIAGGIMRRRDFTTLLAGATVLGVIAPRPPATRAQNTALAVIGVLNGQSTGQSAKLLVAFRRGLEEAGFVEGRNLAIVYRSSEADVGRLPALAKELVALNVAVLAAIGGDNAVIAAKGATTTIPVVFTTGGDPVLTGFVASMNRPGGNLTGVTFLGSLVAPKQIGLLRDVVPNLSTIGLLLNPANPMSPRVGAEVQEAARSVGLKLVVVEANTAAEIEAAFTRFAGQQVDALIIESAVFFNRNRNRLVTLCAQHRLPAIFNNRDFPDDGGLMSYGADTADSYRQAGNYVGRILKGAKPAELPIMQPVRFELVFNLKTARALGLTVPYGILTISDEVIE